MKGTLNIKKFKFYVWVGIAYLFLWVVIDVKNYQYDFLSSVINNIWLAVYIVLINYLFFDYSFPFTLRKKSIFYKILLTTIILCIQALLYSFGLYAWRSIGVGLHLYSDLTTHSKILAGVTYLAPYGFFSALFFGVSRHLYEHVTLRQTSQQLHIEKQQAELNYLKSQTNPHFLFNTLNNIYSLARDKSDLAPESILRLSKILRFMLYEASGEFISIEQELKIITDYISLEKLRYNETLRIDLDFDIENMKQNLPPLLLIPLVENAFKHGVSETRYQPFVEIRLAVHKEQLEFMVNNSSQMSPGQWIVKESIGLSNLRRQLELLYTDYNLLVQQKESTFSASLKINLSSHV